MREQIEILASLQGVDRVIKEKTGAKKAFVEEIREKQGEIDARKSEMAQLRAEWAGKDKLRQEREQLLQDGGRKAMEKRMRMNLVKNIRELQALQHEVDQIKQGNAQLEEELIGIMEDLEARAVLLREQDEELKGLEKAWGDRKGQLETQVAEIEREAAEASAVRQAIAARLNGELIERYELIFSRRGGMAVVTVSEGICQGCYMNIPPQLWNEIIKSERLNLCPSCHRILYYKPTVPGDKQI